MSDCVATPWCCVSSWVMVVKQAALPASALVRPCDVQWAEGRNTRTAKGTQPGPNSCKPCPSAPSDRDREVQTCVTAATGTRAPPPSRMIQPLHSNHGDPAKSVGPIFACFVLIFTVQAASLIETSGAQTKSMFRCPSRGCAQTPAGHNLWTVRGGYQHGRSSSSSSIRSSSGRGQDTFSNGSVDEGDHVRTRGGTAASDMDHHHNIEKLAADLRAKKEHIATHIHDRKEAFTAELKAKQEKIADEVLRERSPEAFGELGGHASSYDSATAVSRGRAHKPYIRLLDDEQCTFPATCDFDVLILKLLYYLLMECSRLQYKSMHCWMSTRDTCCRL